MQPTQTLQATAIRRMPLTTKRAGRGFYKGTRTGSMGRHTKYGGYVVDFEKVRRFIVPDLSRFTVSTVASTNQVCAKKERAWKC